MSLPRRSPAPFSITPLSLCLRTAGRWEGVFFARRAQRTAFIFVSPTSWAGMEPICGPFSISVDRADLPRNRVPLLRDMCSSPGNLYYDHDMRDSLRCRLLLHYKPIHTACLRQAIRAYVCHLQARMAHNIARRFPYISYGQWSAPISCRQDQSLGQHTYLDHQGKAFVSSQKMPAFL